MRIGGHSYTVDYGHFALLTVIAGAVIWYLLDARGVSTSINNLLLVQPTAIFALVMYLLIIPQCFQRETAEPVVQKPEEYDPLAPKLPTERSDVIRMGLLGLSLGVMVFTFNTIGFDVAIFLFAAAAMAICGERRPVRLVLYPLAVTVVAIYGFRALIPFPMFTVIL
ncbi:hypothetical protein G3545_19280 [Starkeya sp. ORNL1]|uniref:tripartite tricarboxylate transporter TctB family protein n=1 Tax=Starkeya sp. ORNL1 TaxID=2709380 RepID=UPI0014646C13|nr:tripartite tricarboxylate transporter TctB family protein [Starkeya sp. ORNL1]QJP15611.1 hypothetical protein G3545_19280 [Starkeya sp. ORNL1]